MRTNRWISPWFYFREVKRKCIGKTHNRWESSCLCTAEDTRGCVYTLVSEVSAGFRSCGTAVFSSRCRPETGDWRADCLWRHAMSWPRFRRRARFGDIIAAKASNYSASREPIKTSEYIYVYIAFSFNWIALGDEDFTYSRSLASGIAAWYLWYLSVWSNRFFLFSHNWSFLWASVLWIFQYKSRLTLAR